MPPTPQGQELWPNLSLFFPSSPAWLRTVLYMQISGSGDWQTSGVTLDNLFMKQYLQHLFPGILINDLPTTDGSTVCSHSEAWNYPHRGLIQAEHFKWCKFLLINSYKTLSFQSYQTARQARALGEPGRPPNCRKQTLVSRKSLQAPRKHFLIIFFP